MCVAVTKYLRLYFFVFKENFIELTVRRSRSMASTSASWKELGAEKIHTIWRSQGERKQKNGIRKSTLLYSNLLCDNQSSKDGYLLKAPAPCNTIILGTKFQHMFSWGQTLSKPQPHCICTCSVPTPHKHTEAVVGGDVVTSFHHRTVGRGR